MRAEARAVFAVLALGCLAAASYLTFDWVDYGLDSTCGNLIRRGGAAVVCADVHRNRLIGVVAFIAAAIVLAALAAWPRRRVAESS